MGPQCKTVNEAIHDDAIEAQSDDVTAELPLVEPHSATPADADGGCAPVRHQMASDDQDVQASTWRQSSTITLLALFGSVSSVLLSCGIALWRAWSSVDLGRSSACPNLKN